MGKKFNNLAAGAAMLGSTFVGGGSTDAVTPPVKPEAKVEVVGEIPGTGEHTGGRVSIGIERDNNGTLNTGEDGEEPGVPARELIPDVMPNVIVGSSDGHDGTTGDGWLWQEDEDERLEMAPRVTSTPTYVTEQTTAQDTSKYPISTPWEVDYQASPELAQEVRGAVQDCFDQVAQRRQLGYELVSIKIGGLASDEGNSERPGDPMANLGEKSQLNADLANQRGLAGIQTAQQLAPANNINPSQIEFLDGQEVIANPEEIEQIIKYAELLGQDPLKLIQDYNRARTEGLQPLMDQLFKGNRGIVCVANYTKEVTSVNRGPDKIGVVFVPTYVEGKERTWRIEIPGEVLLLPLLYVALKMGLAGLGAGGPVLPLSGRTSGSTSPKTTPRPPFIYDPLKKPLKPTPSSIPKPEPLPISTPRPVMPVLQESSPQKWDPVFSLGKGQVGYGQPAHHQKQPRPHNFHGGGKTGQPNGRSKGGNRRGATG